MIPQRLPNPFSDPTTPTQVCAIADRWGLDPNVVDRLIAARGEVPFDLWIFSGSRSEGHQRSVSSTPFDSSTHADVDLDGCPRLATGADVQPVDIANRLDLVTIAQMGAAFTRAGLRWGGGAPVGDLSSDEPGFPVGVERWHVDLGPR